MEYENEYDLTKKMLNIIRVIKESEQNNESSDVIDLEGEELKKEQNKFSDMITPRVSFTNFKLYPNSNNVVFSGVIDSGIEFQLSLKDGAYVNTDNIELNDEVVDVIKKLNGFYVEWSKEWSNKLRNEYNNSDNEGL